MQLSESDCDNKSMATTTTMTPLGQMSPPKPISSIQNNASVIQQPFPVMPLLKSSCKSGNKSSGNPASLMTAAPSPFGSQTLGIPPALTTNDASSAFSAVIRGQQYHQQVSGNHMDVSGGDEASNSKLANLDDLIRLEPPLTEEAIMRTLQARFYNQKYFVSSNCSFQSLFGAHFCCSIFKNNL